MAQEYVLCKKTWHDSIKVTIGKIYKFPNFTDDAGNTWDLSSLHSHWRKEFTFFTEQEYEKEYKKRTQPIIY